MKILAGKPFSSGGWSGRTFELVPDAGAHPAQILNVAVSDDWADWISDRMEAPVLAALFPAMALDEPIRVEHALSGKFHYHLRQVMHYFHLWYPDTLSLIDIECAGFERAEEAGVHTCGCFSGGVDSFHTLLQHRADAEPVARYRMTHGLFVHGFDIPLANEACYAELAATYENLLLEQGVKLVRLRTNLREILDLYVNWMTTHGVALNMCAHFLANGIGRFLIPSTNRFSLMNPPIGSNPITDPQPASESLEIIHHGCEASRIEKIMAIVDWPPVQQHLRVCFQDTRHGMNCGVCNKCHKVMMPLWVSGKLDAFSCFPGTFEPSAVSPSCFSGLQLHRYAREKTYGEELLEVAGRCDMHAVNQLPLAGPRAPGLLQRLRQRRRRA